MIVNFLAPILISVSFFQETPLYENPLASVRSPESAVSLRQSKFFGKRILYLEPQLGKIVPVVNFNDNFQFALEGGAWLMLGYDKGAFPMITQDFYFSFPLYFKLGLLSGALKYNHISSHKGDGIDEVMKEYLSTKDKRELDRFEREEHYSISIIEPLAYSRDYISLDVAIQKDVRHASMKNYARIGYVHRMMPDYLKKWFWAAGLDWRYKLLFASQELSYNQDVRSIDYSAQAGTIFGDIRVALTGYSGSDRRGQFLGRKLNQLGISLFVR